MQRKPENLVTLETCLGLTDTPKGWKLEHWRLKNKSVRCNQGKITKIYSVFLLDHVPSTQITEC